MPKVTEHVHERLNKDLNPNPKCQAANPTFFTAEAHGKVSDTEQAGMADTSLGHLSKGGCQIFVVACTGCSVGAEGPPNTQEAKEQTVVLPVLRGFGDKAVFEHQARLFTAQQETSISICLIKTQAGALGN